jgi:hypothetical protein
LNTSIKGNWNIRDELSYYEGIIFKSDKIIIPKSLQKRMLHVIHEGHFGVTICIQRAKQQVFWLNMSKDIIDFVQSCETCEKHAKSKQKEPLIIRELPTYPFQMVSSDLFHHEGKDYVLIVDHYSNWFHFKMLKSLESKETIRILNEWFEILGYPEKFFSDGGKQYDSAAFREFTKSWNIQHEFSSPHYPQSNGLAEKFVDVAKNILKKDPLKPGIALINYRNTPRKDLGSPNQRALSRNIRCKLPVTTQALEPKIQPNVTNLLQKERESQKKYFDRGSKEATMPPIGSKVVVQDPKTKKWSQATVKDHDIHPRSLIVKTQNGGEYRRNLKFVKPSKSSDSQTSSDSTPLPFTTFNQSSINPPSTQRLVHQDPPIEENFDAEMSGEEHEDGNETIEFQTPPSLQMSPLPTETPHSYNQLSPNHTARLLNFSDDDEPDVPQLPSIKRTRSGREVKKPQKLDL